MAIEIPEGEGGPAFPLDFSVVLGTGGQMGMTVSDWYVGCALTGLIARKAKLDTPEQYADDAYEIVDEIIERRADRRGTP